MKSCFRLICAVLMCALLLAAFGALVLAEEIDTPILDVPFDEPVDTPDNTAPSPDEGMPGWAIVLIIVGSVIVVAVLCFFINWFFVLKRSFSDLKQVFSKKPQRKKR